MSELVNTMLKQFFINAKTCPHCKRETLALRQEYFSRISVKSGRDKRPRVQKAASKRWDLYISTWSKTYFWNELSAVVCAYVFLLSGFGTWSAQNLQIWLKFPLQHQYIKKGFHLTRTEYHCRTECHCSCSFCNYDYVRQRKNLFKGPLIRCLKLLFFQTFLTVFDAQTTCVD